MQHGGDGGAEEEGRGRHADDRLPLAGPADGDGSPQVVQGAVARLHLLDDVVEHPAQCQLVRVEPVGALVVEVVVHG
ncbi:hypothetical protein QFZ66_004056 [Streptomyces sp. B4I13]|uniref:hypothetical protein n=1 Tax=Streptomyces sp. B4I13 TaxID=3042271 RepID=UPI00278A70E7|nr:hypothetical protein [Streptomyces sp. B4I13]MDQ0960178.1 hypothetical protein [Streptomyces sp. B4I13]